MYDYAGSETNVLLDGSIPSQDTQAGEALAQDLPVFVSDVDTQESLPDLFNANAKQMQAVALAGTLPNLYVGMHTGVANKINQSINEGIITKYALNGVAPVDAIQQELQTQEDLAKTTDEAVKNLSKADAELKAEQDKAKQIEQLILGAKYVAPSDQAYIQSIDQLAEMQKNAPVAPTLEQPELTTTDQALIFLAGLIGGNQQVPQAVQGAVAGAQQRAALANQMKTQRFNQEQQNYNRQLQAQQTIVGKEAQVFNQAQQIAGMNYRTELSNLSRREIAQDREVAKMRTQLDATKQKDYDRIIKAYKDMAGRQTEYTPENVKAVESAKAYLIKQLGLPEESVNATLPSVTAGQKTLKGKVMEAKKANDEARLEIARKNVSLAGMRVAMQRAENYLKTLTSDKVLDEKEALAYNAEIADWASKNGIPKEFFPVIEPFVSLDKQKFDWSREQGMFMRDLAIQRLGIAQAREQRLQQAESAFPGTSLKDLNKKLETANSAVASLTGQYNLKVKQGDAKEIAKAETALRGAKDKQEYLNLLIQEKSGNTPPEVQFLYTDLGQAITSGIFGDPADPEAQRTIRAARQIVANRQRRQQQGAKASSPMLPPLKTPTNSTPNPVPNPKPTPQPTPKPTTPTPKPQFVPGGKIIVNGKEIKLR